MTTYLPPLVSVIIPTYNRAPLIESSIRSVFAQDYPNIEVIVVDDGSIDDTELVVSRLADKRLRYFKQTENHGAPAARNVGVREAHGDFLAFLDSDDAWEPNKLSRQMETMVRTGAETALVYTGMRKVDESGATIGFKKPKKRGWIYNDLLRDNVVGSTSTALVRTSAFRAVGGFDETLRSRQDLDLWIRIAAKYRVDFVAAPLVIYSVHRDRISTNVDAKIQGCEAVFTKYFEDIRKKPDILASHYYLLGWLHEKKGELPIAIRYFGMALRARPSPKRLYRYLNVSFRYKYA